MTAKVAGAKIVLETESARAIRDLKKAADEVKRLRKTVDRSANRINYAFNRLRRAAQVVASAFIFTAGIRRLLGLVAAMEKAEDRVKLMEARFQQFSRAGDAFTRVYDLSQRLGQSMETTANSMTRLQIATKSIGTAEPILEDVLENIVLLGRAGGTSAEEMKGAVIQLFQGVASGRLAGEELRSVLENLPLVAMEIADEMDINIGKIREYAAQGKITAQVVIDALSEIGIKMEDLPETFGMQTERLRTEWDLFLADLGAAVESAGLLDALIEAVRWVRINMLGSFMGVSTEALEEQLVSLGNQLQTIEEANARRGFFRDEQPDLPDASEVRGFAAMEAMGAFGDPSVLSNEQQIRAEIARINDELERRADLEAIAERAARLRNDALEDQLTIEDHIARKLLKEFPLRDPFDETLASQKRIDKIVQKAREKSLKEAQEWGEQMKAISEQAARNMQDAFADFLFDPFEDGLKGMLESFLTTIRRMLANQLAMEFFGSDFGKALLGTFGISGFKAMGGPVFAGNAYVVGERGPEVFVPPQSGTIIPNHALMGSSGVNVTYNINAPGADAGVIARMVPLLERTKDATIAEVRNLTREGRL